MNAAQVASEVGSLTDLIRLVEEAQNLVPKPGGRRQALMLLACVEKRLLAMKRRMLEATLTELLWQYLGYCENEDTGAVVRQLIADIGVK